MIELALNEGPLPDDAPSAVAHVHARAEVLAPELVTSLRALFKERLCVCDALGDDAVFLADLAPLPVKKAGGARLLRALSLSGGRGTHPEVSSWALEERLPLILDRGALVCTSERILVSEAVLAQNARLPEGADEDALRSRGWRPRAAEVVKALLAEGFGRPRRDFVFVPTMPGDAHGHAWSWLLWLGDSLLVPEIDQAAFDAIGLVHEVALGRLVQTFLDVQAAELEQKGFTVTRLPMMPPTHLVRSPAREESWVGRCSSPTGGVVVRCGERRLALLPRPSPEGFLEGYSPALEASLLAWREGFARAGYEVVLVDEKPVKERGGSLRRLVSLFPSP